MSEDELLERIVINPKVMVGKPAIKGTRFNVEYGRGGQFSQRSNGFGTLFIFVVLALVTLLAIRSAFAEEYRGGGYRVTIEGWGGDAKYTGCDPKGRCLTIEQASWCERGAYIWENDGYTYCMSPTKKRDGSYGLKIIDPGGKVILKQHMTPVAGASGQDD